MPLYPGRCPGLRAFALSGRAAMAFNYPIHPPVLLKLPTRPGLRASALYLSLRPVTVGSGRAACVHCPGLRASAPSGRATRVHCPGLRVSALSGRAACVHCPGLRASALYLSLRPVTVGSVRAACVHCPGLRASVLSGRVGQNLRKFSQ